MRLEHALNVLGPPSAGSEASRSPTDSHPPRGLVTRSCDCDSRRPGGQNELTGQQMAQKVITRVVLSWCFDYSMSQTICAKVPGPPTVNGYAVVQLTWVATCRKTPLSRAGPVQGQWTCTSIKMIAEVVLNEGFDDGTLPYINTDVTLPQRDFR